MTERYQIVRVLLVSLTVLWACENPFSYSPFEVNVPEEIRNTTEKNLKKIASLDSVSTDSVFRIALISDVHYHYSELRDVLDDINSRSDISFIIVTGDITENGLQKEFELFHSVMNNSLKPYLTVIGNHDYLSNGGKVYQQMFGSLNYAFVFQHVKFVMWDNVLWESNKLPDWEWLKTNLGQSTEDNGKSYRHIVPFSHIPPFDGQLVDKAELFNELLMESRVNISIHGHKHEYFAGDLFGNGIQYVTVGSPQKGGYAVLTFTPQQVQVARIEF